MENKIHCVVFSSEHNQSLEQINKYSSRFPITGVFKNDIGCFSKNHALALSQLLRFEAIINSGKSHDLSD